MSQFIAYANPNPATRKLFPYLLDIQSDLLDELRTTVVVPLCPATMVGEVVISKLSPAVEIDSRKYLVFTQQIAAVDRKALGKKVCDLSGYRTTIIAALDFVISGI